MLDKTPKTMRTCPCLDLTQNMVVPRSSIPQCLAKFCQIVSLFRTAPCCFFPLYKALTVWAASVRCIYTSQMSLGEGWCHGKSYTTQLTQRLQCASSYNKAECESMKLQYEDMCKALAQHSFCFGLPEVTVVAKTCSNAVLPRIRNRVEVTLKLFAWLCQSGAK